MSLPLVPTTELEAVNAMLASIGEAPVNQLENTGLGDAATARQRLHETSRRVQMRGWSWNTDYNFTLTRTLTNVIPLPANTLKCKPLGNFARAGYVVRSGQLYDTQNHTSIFSTSVSADIVYFLAFETLPESARHAIYLAAAASFQAGYLGSAELDKFTGRDAQMAWSDLISEELEVTECSMFTDSDDMVVMLNRSNVGAV